MTHPAISPTICPRLITTETSPIFLYVLVALLTAKTLFVICNTVYHTWDRRNGYHVFQYADYKRQTTIYTTVFWYWQLLFDLLCFIYGVTILVTMWQGGAQSDIVNVLGFITVQAALPQLLHLLQLVPALGPCIFTLLQMFSDLFQIFLVILVFVLHQTFVLRNLITSCPLEVVEYGASLLQFSLSLISGFNLRYQTNPDYLFYVWYLFTVIVGSLLLMNFIIGVFANTVTQITDLCHADV